MSGVVELFGLATSGRAEPDWQTVVRRQVCPFVDRRCFKVRKSMPEVSIGTCTVLHGGGPVVICPIRMLERRQVLTDCLHLLTGHEPGNELHVVPEVGVPGGNIDYVLASARDGRVRDFVGIELQTLDTTGTVWPVRQRFLASQGVPVAAKDLSSVRPYGMNWKMTAKTILVQLHHKVQTFESVNKHLVLVLQDRLLSYMQGEFSFRHLNQPRVADPMHFHAYSMAAVPGGHRLSLASRLSTDTAGIAVCLGLQGETRIELDVIVRLIEQKIGPPTLLALDRPVVPMSVPPEV